MNENQVIAMLEAMGLGAEWRKDNLRNDSDATSALSRQLEHIKSKTYDILYANMKAKTFIPVSTEVDPGAETIVTREWNHTGMAEIIANYADDLPLVDAFVNENTIKVQTIGSAYEFTRLDMMRSMKSQSDLDSRRAASARLAIERKIDRIAAIGDSSVGLTGFLNHPNVPLVVLPNGGWAAATSDEILEDLYFLENSIVLASLEVHAPDTILLDPVSFGIVNTKPTGVDNKQSVLKTYLENSPYVKNVDQWTRLATADNAGTGPRIMAYQRDPMMVELEIPLEFEQLPPQPRNLSSIIPVIARIGGTRFHYPLSAAYADNAN